MIINNDTIVIEAFLTKGIANGRLRMRSVDLSHRSHTTLSSYISSWTIRRTSTRPNLGEVYV